MAESQHIPNAISIPELTLVAVCDTDQKRLSVIKKKFGLQNCYVDSRKVLEKPDVEAVIISTPTQTHSQIAIEAARAGKHVFIEKPMATTVKEADDIIEAVEEQGVKLMVGHQSRFLSTHRKGKKIINKGEIGDIFYGEAHCETLIIKLEEGALLDYGVHCIDLLCWYFDDARVERVAASLHSSDGAEKNTEATMILEFSNGVVGRIGVFWMPHFKSWSPADRYVKILGTKGKIISDWSTPCLQLYKEGSLISRLKGLHTIMVEKGVNPKIPLSDTAYRRELEHFARCVLRDREPEVSGEWGRMVLRVVEAAEESSEKSRFVSLLYD